MRKEKIDPVFIMADNDARPLKTIDKSVFVTEDKYNAYYFYDLDSWEGAINPTSFDIGAKKAAKYLHDHGYSSLMFSSHMPQVIDKALFVKCWMHIWTLKWQVFVNGAHILTTCLVFILE